MRPSTAWREALNMHSSTYAARVLLPGNPVVAKRCPKRVDNFDASCAEGCRDHEQPLADQQQQQRVEPHRKHPGHPDSSKRKTTPRSARRRAMRHQLLGAMPVQAHSFRKRQNTPDAVMTTSTASSPSTPAASNGTPPASSSCAPNAKATAQHIHITAGTTHVPKPMHVRTGRECVQGPTPALGTHLSVAPGASPRTRARLFH
jgi:hypothetical protein